MSEPKSERNLFVEFVRMTEHSHALCGEVFLAGQYAILKQPENRQAAEAIADDILSEYAKAIEQYGRTE